MALVCVPSNVQSSTLANRFKIFYKYLYERSIFSLQLSRILSLQSIVGSYVWSHLTSVLRSEDPSKLSLIESLPDDVISREFESEFLKYSSYSEYTVATGNHVFSVVNKLLSSPELIVRSNQQ